MFPLRFYFLSDDELLEILSQTKDPTAVQPHLRKCFENIALVSQCLSTFAPHVVTFCSTSLQLFSVCSQLQFQPDLLITHMYSGEGEEVKLFVPVNPAGNVEEWLRHVEKSMKATLRDNIDRSLKVYPEVRSFLFPVFQPEKNCCCSNISLFADPSATSYRVGVVLARTGGHCWLSGLLDHRGV